MCNNLDNTQAEFPPPSENGRDRRYKLRSVAAKILNNSRVCTCGVKTVGSVATVVVGKERGAYIAGVETCGSIWNCPVCAGKIAEGRREEVKKAVDGHKAAGGHLFMMTLTVPHRGFETAYLLRTGVANAWRRFLTGNPWIKQRDRFDIRFIRSMEVTHGKNGWHPHLHVLLFTKAINEVEEFELKDWFFERWAKVVKRAGLGKVSGRAFQFERVENSIQAGDYVAKWGVDCEIAKATVKLSTKGGRSPWQLLADAGRGDAESIMLFREYAAAFKGARHITWSKGLKDFYAVDKKSDEELAFIKKPYFGDKVIGTLRRMVWHRVQVAGAVPAVLAAAETGGWDAVLLELRARKLVL